MKFRALLRGERHHGDIGCRSNTSQVIDDYFTTVRAATPDELTLKPRPVEGVALLALSDQLLRRDIGDNRSKPYMFQLEHPRGVHFRMIFAEENSSQLEPKP